MLHIVLKGQYYDLLNGRRWPFSIDPKPVAHLQISDSHQLCADFLFS